MAPSPDWPGTRRPSEVVTTRNPEVDQSAVKAHILVLNHHRDEMGSTLEAVRNQGFGVTETQSIIETHRVLAKLRPELILLNPLVLQRGSVELELLEELQRDDDPVPVILLIDTLDAVHTARNSRLTMRDFIRKPFSTEELLHRIELKLLSREQFLAMRRRTKELEDQVLEDFKTKLINDRHFKQIQVVEFKRAQRHNTPLSLLLVDIDDFKAVNDSTEYTFGDEVLVHVAHCLKHTTRDTDYAARFGGDEFALLLPHTTPQEAVQTANRVRRAISSMQVESRGYALQVTVSIGIGTFDGRSRMALDDLQHQANKALHEAKLLGKDQISLYSEG